MFLPVPILHLGMVKQVSDLKRHAQHLHQQQSWWWQQWKLNQATCIQAMLANHYTTAAHMVSLTWSHSHVPTQPGSCHQSTWVEPQTIGHPCLGYRKLISSSCTSFRWLWWLPHLYLNAWNSPQRLTPYLSFPCPLWMCLIWMRSHCGWHCSHCPDSQCSIARISSGLGWTGGGLVGSFPCGLELGLASGTNLGMSSSPFVELC